MDATGIAVGLHRLERHVVPHLKKKGTMAEVAAAAKLLDVEATRALQWLEGKGCLSLQNEEQELIVITQKGKQAHAEGLPETHAITALKKKKILFVAELASVMPSYDKKATGAVIGALKQAGIPFITQDGKPAFKWIDGIGFKAPVAEALQKASKSNWQLDVEIGKELLKRQGYAERQKVKGKSYTLTKLGVELTKQQLSTEEQEERLTPAMLKDGSWKGKSFRPYNVAINVPQKRRGKKHFVNEAIDYIKRVWLDMGFTEMVGNDVQTAFWDLDALFVPQDHPAREMQDTFYIDDPAEGRLPKLFNDVKAVHEHGADTGSTGWRYSYSKEEAKRNLLRTHTTVLSAQTLHKIRTGEIKTPCKFFSVAKVYRNEALDWKHLFEFYQVDCIVVGEGLTMSHLKGYLKLFFRKLGYTDVRIRPAHFPYTEPSAEVDVYDPDKEEWIELGGSGIFRPEVTKTLTGKEIPVLAWGLGMERSIKEYYGIKDIRDLYRNDAEQLRNMGAWLR